MILKYRPEIDGLRAIAVFAVVIYHGEFTVNSVALLPGGFLGVDVFFVLSGYLISSIILKECQGQGFSFSRFYSRRARRILPALFLVLTAALPFAWTFMLPLAAKQFAGSGISALFFGSNFWFWSEDSYTAEASALKPLLHTWTLSVEEQFYLFFPVAIVLVWRFARRYLDSLIAAALIVSLISAEVASVSAPDANFYLLPFRGWELLIGAVLAHLQTAGVARAAGVATASLPAIGLALILVPVFCYSDDIRHPSYLTAAPVAGTAIIIWFARKGELVTDLLSTKPFRFFGLTSYSFYLWHFPAIAFLKIYDANHSQWMMAATITASAALSFAAYFFIEQPMRKASVTPARVFYPILTAWFLSLLAAFSFLYYTNGAPARLGPVANLFSDLRSPPIRQLGATCDPNSAIALCEAKFSGEGEAKGNVVLLGDSHAMALTEAAIEYAHANDRNLVRISTAGCPYIIGTYSVINSNTEKPGCGASRWRAIQEYLAQADPALVIYASNLPFYMNEAFYDNGEDAPVVRANLISLEVEKDFAARGLGLGELVKFTIEDMLGMGHHVALIYPIPEAGYDVPSRVLSELSQVAVSQRFKAFQELDLSTSYGRYRQFSRSAKNALNSAKGGARLMRVFPNRLLCSSENERCAVTKNSQLLYFDENHVSVHGAELIIQDLDETVQDRFP